MQAPSLISRILFSSPDFIIDKNKAGLSGLKANQVVDAKVIKVLSGGKAQLVIKGETVTAKTHIVLKQDEMVRLKVIDDGDTKVLRLVKNDAGPVMPEGLKEMRTFGRSGLYSKLTTILSDFAPVDKTLTSSKPVTVDKPLTSSKPVTVDSLIKDPVIKGEGFLKTGGLKDGITTSMVAKSDVSVKINTVDLKNFRLFLNDKNIPFPLKAAIVIAGSQTEPAVVPQTVMARLADKIVPIIDNGKQPEPALPVMTRLNEFVKAFKGTLPAGTAALIDNVIDKGSIPFEFKLLTTLMTGKNVSFAGESASVQPFLVKSLEQKGFNPIVDLQSVLTEGNIHTTPVSIKSASAAKQLETLLDLVSLKPENMPDDESLKTIVRNTGLMWESKVKSIVESFKDSPANLNTETLVNSDIKALAMKMLTVMEGENKQAAANLRSFVDGLEKMQLFNRHSIDESGRYLLPLPFFSEETLKFGQLLVDLDRDGNSSDKAPAKAVRVAFILEMSRLGNLKADFAIYKKSVSGTFGVENTEVQTLINELLPGLTETLAKKGYQVKKICCDVISSGELVGGSLTDMVLDNTDGLLNIVV